MFSYSGRGADKNSGQSERQHLEGALNDKGAPMALLLPHLSQKSSDLNIMIEVAVCAQCLKKIVGLRCPSLAG